MMFWLLLIGAIEVSSPDTVDGLINFSYSFTVKNTGLSAETLDIVLCFDKELMSLRYARVWLTKVPKIKSVSRYGYKEFTCSHKWKPKYYDEMTGDTVVCDSGCYACIDYGIMCGVLVTPKVLGDSNSLLRKVPYITLDSIWVNIGKLDLEHLKLMKDRIDALDSVALDPENAVSEAVALNWLKKYRDFSGRKVIINEYISGRWFKGGLRNTILPAGWDIDFDLGFKRLKPLPPNKGWLLKKERGRFGIIVRDNQNNILIDTY